LIQPFEAGLGQGLGSACKIRGPRVGWHGTGDQALVLRLHTQEREGTANAAYQHHVVGAHLASEQGCVR
jgi:hypothetical protein